MDDFLQNQAVMKALVPPEYAAALHAMNQASHSGAVMGGGSVGNATALAVYNLPFNADDKFVLNLFPQATRVNIIMTQSDPKRPRGMSILRFNSPQECQIVFDQINRGVEIEGRQLRVEISTNPRYQASDSEHNVDVHQFRGHQAIGGPERISSGCSLMVHNLPWSATERDLLQEFPTAQRATMLLNDQGQSKGISLLTFTNRDDCSSALVACACKVMNGRALRAEIRDVTDEGDRDYNQGNRRRDNGMRPGNDRSFGRDRGHDNRRDRDRDRDREYGRERNRDRDRESFRGGRDDRRGGGGGGRFDRDRRGGRDNRGSGGGIAAGRPRITSAVIRRIAGDSSDSEFDDDHNY